MTIQEKAAEAYKYFESKSRRSDNGSYWALKEDAPNWVIDLVRVAHDDGAVLPNDYTYEEIVDSLDTITRLYQDEDIDVAKANFTGGVSPYTSDSLKWLQDYPASIEAIDEYRTEFGVADNFADELLQVRTYIAEHTLSLVYQYLEDAVAEED